MNMAATQPLAAPTVTIHLARLTLTLTAHCQSFRRFGENSDGSYRFNGPMYGLHMQQTRRETAFGEDQYVSVHV